MHLECTSGVTKCPYLQRTPLKYESVSDSSSDCCDSAAGQTPRCDFCCAFRVLLPLWISFGKCLVVSLVILFWCAQHFAIEIFFVGYILDRLALKHGQFLLNGFGIWRDFQGLEQRFVCLDMVSFLVINFTWTNENITRNVRALGRK